MFLTKLASSFNWTFRYIENVLPLYICKGYIDRIYPIELEITDTTDTSDLYLNLYLKIDNEGRLRTELYEKG